MLFHFLRMRNWTDAVVGAYSGIEIITVLIRLGIIAVTVITAVI